MQAILGVIFHLIGGAASGSFYLPFKKVKGWSWESYWIIGGLFSWLIVPPLAAYLTIPAFAEIISNTDNSILKVTFIMGLLWGIGGLTYGLGFVTLVCPSETLLSWVSVLPWVHYSHRYFMICIRKPVKSVLPKCLMMKVAGSYFSVSWSVFLEFSYAVVPEC
jgi:hypothetical protein